MTNKKCTLTAHTFFITLITGLLLFGQLNAEGFSSSTAFGSSEPSFLPVEEAYSVTPNVNGQTLAFNWFIADGYYLYKHQFAIQAVSDNQRNKLDFDIAPGKKKYDEIFQEEVEVYYHDAKLTATLPDWPRPFEIHLSSQGCADAGLCYPPRTQMFLVKQNGIVAIEQTTIPAKPKTSLTTTAEQAPIAEETGATETQPMLVVILIGALLGGMILNLMPCVFPVLSLKALSLASGDEHEHRRNGWAYTAGVVLSFLVVAAIIVAAKSAGTSLGWGFQLQQPSFVAALFYLFFLLGLNLFGFFEIGTGFMGVGNGLTQGSGRSASFFTGVLAAVVASPCTAPFMATAIGFTISQGSIITALVFASLGFGMALPYLALSHSPTIAAKLPAPGPWMDTFKQFLAFPLLFTCVWLLTVLGQQTHADASAMLVGGAIAIAMAIWLWKKQPAGALKWAARGFAIMFFATAINIALNIRDYGQTEGDIWQEYTPELLHELRNKNQAVFVDLTADWCITCKINERIALDIDRVSQYASDHNIAMLRGDWTLSDPDITTLLRKHKRNGVPLYLMYPTNPNEAPEVLPQVLTPQVVLDAMARASE